MTQKSFVIFVNIILDNGLLPFLLIQDRLFEAGYYLFENGLVEDKLFTIHYTLYVILG